MKRTLTLLSLTSGLFLFTLLIFPAKAVTALQTAPVPESTVRAGYICDEGLPQPVVHIILFWMNGCPHCHEVLDNILPPLQEKYGTQLDILLVEVVGMDDVNRLYDIAATYGYSRDQVGVPFLIIGEDVLIGSQQIPKELPSLIEFHLAQGGVERPSIPGLNEFPSLTTPVPVLDPAISDLVVQDAPSTAAHSNGFTLAIVIMVLMAAALLYSLIALWRGVAFFLPVWADWLIPALIIVGIGVAGYLSYVETQSVDAICGPVGDCNTVQQSRYARLFDVLPVGVFGLLGYLGLSAAWLVRRFLPRLEKPAAIVFWGMAFFAVIFSLYLTYLEPFVIKAVCIWCLSSAVIVTLLLLLGTPPAVLQFAISDEDG
ncbi:MAG: vitamin K epoxide reductase family protein [Anaerolineales bacterium]